MAALLLGSIGRSTATPFHLPPYHSIQTHVQQQGKFHPLREWLTARVHSQGSLPESLDALLVSATGKPLDPTCFVRYLQAKYAALYDLEDGSGEGKDEL